MVFLGKTENDMFIVALEKSLKVTRLIKRVFSDMKQHLGLYQTLTVMSWMIEGTLETVSWYASYVSRSNCTHT